MNARLTTGLALAALLLGSGAALADPYKPWKQERHGRGFSDYDYARVVDVEPLVRRIRVTEPRERCYQDTVYERVYEGPGPGYRPPVQTAAGSMILGGILGAAVGNQIGSGDGRRAATVAGALIGSAIGHDVAGRRQVAYAQTYPAAYSREVPRTVERCEVSYDESWEERIEGYHVTYVYNGRRMTTRLPYDPGDRIRVRVDVRPDHHDD
jgi:uncharacterized protein YcfJ